MTQVGSLFVYFFNFVDILGLFDASHSQDLNTYVERNKEAKYSMLSEILENHFLAYIFFCRKRRF